ncbi:MAG: helix-turn-helix transcriptional regulator [Chloroflexota bacterium]
MNDREIAKIFGVVVRQMRKEKGLSQEDFADVCKLHRTYVGSIERGEKNVTLETASKIAEALGVSLSELIFRVEQQSQANDRTSDYGS